MRPKQTGARGRHQAQQHSGAGVCRGEIQSRVRQSLRLKHTHAKLIDFKNRLLSDAFGKACISSMEQHHGVKPQDIINDCTILVTTLKNGVDLFLSEDYHFTSKVTNEVIEGITNKACTEFHQMCGQDLYSINAETFLGAYTNGKIDIDVIESRLKDIRKPGKRL